MKSCGISWKFIQVTVKDAKAELWPGVGKRVSANKFSIIHQNPEPGSALGKKTARVPTCSSLAGRVMAALLVGEGGDHWPLSS